MILTSFLIAFGLIKCSQIKQNDVKIPLMKGQDDQQFPMNHMNVLLQSLYNSCPLRSAVFLDYDSNIITAKDRKFTAASAPSNPLELIFAKMHHDIENNGETEASIYFTDTYLKTATTTDPIEFYSWLTRDLFESQEYRKLLQWEILTCKKSSESTSQVFIEDGYTFLSIQSEKYDSIQNYLDELFSDKIEKVVVTSDGESQEKTVQISRELVNPPTIGTFLIKRQVGELEDFGVEETIHLNKEYKLNSFIIIENDKYSVCIKGKDSSWYKVQDNNFVMIDHESAMNLVSKFGYILFYIDNEFTSCSPKPSQELIVKSCTKDMIHGISKSIQKQSNSPPLKPSSLPIKNKNMLLNDLAYSNVKTNVSPRRSSSHLSLQDLPSKKAPSPLEMAHLDAILVRADLSDVKMNLLKTDQIGEKDESEDGNSVAVAAVNENRKQMEDGDSFDNFGLFTEAKLDQEDVELEYFKEIDPPQQKPPRSMDVWSQHYLKQAPQYKSESRLGLFAGFLEFEIDFHENYSAAASTNHQAVITAEDEDEEELFMKATLAKIRKSRSDGVDKPDATFNKQINPKKQNKKSPLKIQEARSILSSGLFYRQQQQQQKAAILPSTTSSEKLADEQQEVEKVKKQREKRINRYSKF